MTKRNYESTEQMEFVSSFMDNPSEKQALLAFQQASTSDIVSDEVNQQLFQEHGCTLILLNVPGCHDAPGYETKTCKTVPFEFGIDGCAWQIGSRFAGLKMIAPGVHFCYYSLGNGEAVVRRGFFLLAKPGLVHVRKWNSDLEDFEVITDISSFKANVRTFEPYLAPYPLQQWQIWRRLTRHLSWKTIEKCIPGLEMDSMQGSNLLPLPKFNSDYLGSSKRNNVSGNHEKLLHFTVVDFKQPAKDQHLQGIALTTACLDRSQLLLVTVKQIFGSFNALLSEFELAFICLLCLHNYDTLEQWQRLLRLLCSSPSALRSNLSDFIPFLETFSVQFSVPEMDLIVQDNVALLQSLRDLYDATEVRDSDTDKLKRVLTQTRRLLQQWAEKHDIDLEAELEDEQPVIV